MEGKFEYLGPNIQETDTYVEEKLRLQRLVRSIIAWEVWDNVKKTNKGSFTSEALKAWVEEYVEIFRKGEEFSKLKLNKSPFYSFFDEDIFCVPLALGTGESVDSYIVKKSVLSPSDQNEILYIGMKEEMFKREFPILSDNCDCYVSSPYDKKENLAVVPVDMTRAVEDWGN